jgi:hypothetical protein
METDERRLLDDWMAKWSDVVEFDVYAVMASKDAAARVASRL